MDNKLAIWAQPHSFYWLRGEQGVDVFTFGLAMPAVLSLASTSGAAEFGDRFGFEWLATLADSFTAGDGRSQLGRYLEDEVGIVAPAERTGAWLFGEAQLATTVPEFVLEAFAASEGLRIHDWALNAFGGLNLILSDIARGRERIPSGYGHVARNFLRTVEQLQGRPFRHELVRTQLAKGGSTWGIGYQTLLERLALELMDLAVRRPQFRVCRLCTRVYVPFKRSDPPYCWGRLWARRQLVRDCLAGHERLTEKVADQRERYRRAYKTEKAKVYRERRRYGEGHGRVTAAERRFELWKDDNPAPERQRQGRHPLRAPGDTPPVTPGSGA